MDPLHEYLFSDTLRDSHVNGSIQLVARKMNITDWDMKSPTELVDELKMNFLSVYKKLESYLLAYMEWFKTAKRCAQNGGAKGGEKDILSNLEAFRTSTRAALAKEFTF